MEVGLLLSSEANDPVQAPLDQALFGRAGLVWGKVPLPCKAQAAEQGLFFLSRERR